MRSFFAGFSPSLQNPQLLFQNPTDKPVRRCVHYLFVAIKHNRHRSLEERRLQGTPSRSSSSMHMHTV
ncbi:hypothetical protein WQE_08532 [Paraburkholderia hospita]|uniref:Transposase n=1 Tax=Paraburkholderia hospita TaxID=169430 RepID=A0ABN0FRW7_9BURK|nr:hypothetical protein WQE_08532 [Paraburkholderia hospita]OUL70266.1 hypothetical protein CA602_48355 [Paraburkholderia hospita]